MEVQWDVCCRYGGIALDFAIFASLSSFFSSTKFADVLLAAQQTDLDVVEAMEDMDMRMVSAFKGFEAMGMSAHYSNLASGDRCGATRNRGDLVAITCSVWS